VARRRDLLQTLVVLGLVATPAWLTPAWFGRPWLLLTLLLVGPSLWLSWWHAPWVPTPPGDLQKISNALGLVSGQRFVDLGAGDGRTLVALAACSGAQGIGIEASPMLYLVGRLRVMASGVSGVQMRWGDLYRAELAEVDAVYVWGTGYSAGTERFSRFLKARCRPGCVVVSYHTPLWGLEPVSVDRSGQRPVFRYRLGT
jgi:SAM-dependent methyltransferase